MPILFLQDQIKTLSSDLKKIAQLQNISLAPRAHNQLLASFRKQLERLCIKVLLIYFYDTPEPRLLFSKYCATQAHLSNRISQDYPLLLQNIAELTKIYQQSFTKLCQDLRNDWQDLLAAFSIAPDQSIRMTAIKVGTGDLHLGSFGTTELELNTKKIFYKFRPLSADLLLEQLIQSLNWPLAIPKSLSYPDHGWQIKIEHAYAKNQQELRIFYHNVGFWLALCSSLRGSDYHFENMIAAGSQPYLIDFETFSCPPYPHYDVSQHYHFLGIGLLPSISFSDSKKRGIDMSAIGYQGHGYWPEPQEYLAGRNSSAPRYQKKYQRLKPQANLPCPVLTEAIWQLAEKNVLAGFQQGMHDIMRHKARLLNLLAEASDTPVRALLRPTNTYANLVGHANHPQLLQEQKRRLQYFQQIFNSRHSKGLPEHVIQTELDSMLLGYIPYFNTTLGGRTLFSGKQVIAEQFFSDSAFNKIQEQIQCFDAAKLAHQSQLIKSSFACARLNRGNKNAQRAD